MYTYEGGWSDSMNPPTVMAPFTGYTVYSYYSANVIIKLKPEPAGNVEKPIVESEHISWMLTIKAFAGEAKDTANHLGVRKDAQKEWDIYDHVEPPPIGDYVSVSFPHHDWDKYPYVYTVDFRPPDSIISWDFDVKTNIPREQVTIQLAGIEKLPTGLYVKIIDRDREHDINFEDNTFNFISGNDIAIRHFRLIVSDSNESEPYELSSKPEKFVTATCYPNPFNPSTTIQYKLPRPGKVVISVFNSLGQRERRYDLGNKDEGIYDFVFDASGLTSGLYFYRVDTGYASVTNKMLFMK